MRALAFLAFAALLCVLFAPAGANTDSTTLACEPPRIANKLIVQGCSVSGTVTQSFLVKMYFSQGDLGAVEVDARGPGSNQFEQYRFLCPVALTVAVCVGPVALEPAFAGTWTFTANPAVTDLSGAPWVRMEVIVT